MSYGCETTISPINYRGSVGTVGRPKTLSNELLWRSRVKATFSSISTVHIQTTYSSLFNSGIDYSAHIIFLDVYRGYDVGDLNTKLQTSLDIGEFSGSDFLIYYSNQQIGVCKLFRVISCMVR